MRVSAIVVDLAQEKGEESPRGHKSPNQGKSLVAVDGAAISGPLEIKEVVMGICGVVSTYILSIVATRNVRTDCSEEESVHVQVRKKTERKGTNKNFFFEDAFDGRQLANRAPPQRHADTRTVLTTTVRLPGL